METISADDFKNRYGAVGAASFKPPEPDHNPISNAFHSAIAQFSAGKQQAAQATNPLQMTEAGLKEGAGLVGAAFSPLAPATQYIGKGIDAVANKVSDIPAVQKFANSPAGNVASRAAEDVTNTATLMSLRGGGEVPRAVGGAVDATKGAVRAAGEATGQVGKYASNAVKDIVPDSQRRINHQISKGLDFTPGDLAKITESTGNDVGTYMSDHNLIGSNKATTKALIEDFNQKNYTGVRAEIKKVDDMGITHDAETIPGYKQATAELNNKISEVPGLEKEAAEIKALNSKPNPTLGDVQRVKELIDKHSSLYNSVGDVAQNVAKQGLANIRKQLQTYIEDTVQKYTKADIREMNNHVATTRDISDTITLRDPKGLTKANLSMRDLGAFWFGSTFGGPLGGAALLFIKKVAETPTVRLRVARYLDGVSDARKAAIKADLEQGEIPLEFNQFIKSKGVSAQKVDTPAPFDGTVYRGGEKGVGFSASERGHFKEEGWFSVTPDKKTAKGYGSSVVEGKLSPDAKVKDFGGYMFDMEKLKAAEKDGYDAAKFLNKDDEIEIVVFNKKAIQSSPSLPKEVGKPKTGGSSGKTGK